MILTWTVLLQVEKNVPFSLCLCLWGNIPSNKFVRTREAVWGAFMQPLLQWKSSNSSIFWMDVFSLSYPDAMRMRPIVICGLPRYTNFFSFSLKRCDFPKELLNTEYVFRFFLHVLSETFLILRRIQRNIIMNPHSFYIKYPLFLPDFNEALTSSTDCRKILEYQIIWKSVHCEPTSRIKLYFRWMGVC